MFRYSLVVVVGLCTAGAASAASWADGMFDELSRDFGSVPRGPTLTHPFHLTNNTATAVHIAGVRVSCGCTQATALRTELAPGQGTVILAQMDTRRFSGVKAVTIFVQFDQPQWEEVRLWVQANSRDDVTITPDSLAFGKVKRGSSPVTSVDIALMGNGQWRILRARCESNYVQMTLQELRHDDNEVDYRLTAKLRSDAPVGKWYTDVWLTTNDAATPRVRVPLTAEIDSVLSMTPATVVLGKIKAGFQAQRRIIVRGVRPFRITAVEGTDHLLTVKDGTQDRRPVHVLTITVQSPKPEEFNRPIDVNRTIRVMTDLSDDAQIEFHAKAQIVP
jgi:hypothetical protein